MCCLQLHKSKIMIRILMKLIVASLVYVCCVIQICANSNQEKYHFLAPTVEQFKRVAAAEEVRRLRCRRHFGGGSIHCCHLFVGFDGAR